MNSIYQIALRSFCAEGTLQAAAELLPHVKECGFDVVYLCPVFEEDDDPDRATWSPRQLKSECGNPKNPYKMKDYFKVDEEFGDNDDLRDFIDAAHKLGLKVLLDLVYLHCGRNAVFVKDHPDWVEQDENGAPLVGADWPFARINYSNQAVREYLWENMVTLIRDYRADGFRCDVGDRVPLDFWAEGKRRITAVNPDVILFDEGSNPDYIREVFDLNYNGLGWGMMAKLFAEDDPADLLRKTWEYRAKNKGVHFFENHDSASDAGLLRPEKQYSSDQIGLFMALIYTFPGVPMLFNGNEIADSAEQCMFSNRFYGKRAGIDWSNLLRERGKKRMELIKALSALRSEYPYLADGGIEFLDAPSRCVCFKRGELTVVLNFGDTAVPLPSGTLLLSQNRDSDRLGALGFAVIKN